MGFPFTIVCPKCPLHPSYDTSSLPIVYWGHGNSHLWEQLILPLYFVTKKDYVVLNLTGLGSILTCHKIMTIHDLSFLVNPTWFSRGYYWWYRFMTPLAAWTSSRILTVSEFSKREILRFYPFLKEQNIIVAYGAADQKFAHVDKDLTPAEEPFALAVSSRDPRKNFARLIEAFKNVEGCKLYIVGGVNNVFTQNSQLSQDNDHVRFLGRISDEELVKLYGQASCFIFPSLYEGFGLPPIEAMSCGCPVLASDIPVLREVCGDAALYFNPYDIESITHAIQHFLEHKNNLAPTLQEKGYENLKRFTFERTAQIIVQLVQQCSE